MASGMAAKLKLPRAARIHLSGCDSGQRCRQGIKTRVKGNAIDAALFGPMLGVFALMAIAGCYTNFALHTASRNCF